MKRSAEASAISSNNERRATVIEENGLHSERIEKATLLQEALSKAGAVRAQRRKQVLKRLPRQLTNKDMDRIFDSLFCSPHVSDTDLGS
ncbi:hypothetical protein Tcan_18010 [Toxocara canis]|uniref:Uncharacterized protein n=1 Tax=Toxocara canis TaxID=6265 RepID=A0A0B2VJ57_TOXCA|nr:hypothetical protein Tcan_18010 [Toxocara canis]